MRPPPSLPDRPAARLLVIDALGRLLLFRFTAGDRPPFWATPGGALDPGESYEDAARRELLEETGIVADPGRPIDERMSIFKTFDGVKVRAVERYFVIRVPEGEIATERHTALERQVMQTHRWWTLDDFGQCVERFYPRDLEALWRAELETAK